MRFFRWVKSIFVKPKPKPPIQPVTTGLNCPSDVAVDYTRLLYGVKVMALPKNVTELVKKHVHRFKAVADMTHVPWQVIAFIAIRETGFDWKKYKKTGELDFNWHRCLHNGDRWDRVTTHVPSGLGPWTSWESAAADALNRRRRPSSWNSINLLWFLEKYNGLGYRKYHSHVKSPYLWGYTNRYTKGGYKADGKWSNSYVNKQIGATAFMLHFGLIDIKLTELSELKK